MVDALAGTPVDAGKAEVFDLTLGDDDEFEACEDELDMSIMGEGGADRDRLEGPGIGEGERGGE